MRSASLGDRSAGARRRPRWSGSIRRGGRFALAAPSPSLKGATATQGRDSKGLARCRDFSLSCSRPPVFEGLHCVIAPHCGCTRAGRLAGPRFLIRPTQISLERRADGAVARFPNASKRRRERISAAKVCFALRLALRCDRAVAPAGTGLKIPVFWLDCPAEQRLRRPPMEGVLAALE
jgi:hypothetical protein